LAYVTDSERHELAIVELSRRRVVGRVPVGGPCRHLAIDRGGTQLWVALGNNADELAVLSLAERHRPRVVSRIESPFLAHDVGFTPGGRRVWLTSGDRGRIAIYDARRGELVRTLAGDAPPQHVTFLGRRAYVTSGDDGLLRVHALDGRLLRTLRVPLGSYNVTFGWGRVVSPSLSGGTLSVLGRDGRVDAVRTVARAAHDACIVIGP
jgi:DNA-binding beta-propeller fold protein YncE